MIGKTVWIYDGNHRVYPSRKAGEAYTGCGPIYRLSWRPQKIAAENRVSWITDRGIKIPKKAEERARRSGVAMNEQELEDAIYAHDNRHRISNMIDRLDPAKLREVAKLIGYVPPPEAKPEFKP